MKCSDAYTVYFLIIPFMFREEQNKTKKVTKNKLLYSLSFLSDESQQYFMTPNIKHLDVFINIRQSEIY